MGTLTALALAQMVLGGYSQGAGVMGFVTAAKVPAGVAPATVPIPLQPDIADHVSSVVLFALPNERATSLLGQPTVAIGPSYQAKTLQICAPEDAVCSEGFNFATHSSETYGDMVDKAVDFAASHLAPDSGGPSSAASEGEGAISAPGR